MARILFTGLPAFPTSVCTTHLAGINSKIEFELQGRHIDLGIKEYAMYTNWFII